MKVIQNKLLILLFIALAIPQVGSSQENLTAGLDYEVNTVYPPLSITKERLNTAQTLSDLNRHYKSSWIREFISVEIWASHKGKTRKAKSKDDTLTEDQKHLMNQADVGTAVSVKVRYMPENTLTHNDVKEVNFSFLVNPECEAKYAEGEEQLKKYLQEKAIGKIPEGIFENYDLAAVKFTIDEQGGIIDAHIFESSKNEKIDELLMETICNMPNWKPAEYTNGVKVKQQFVLTVGNMENCVVNLLNIRQDW